MNAENFMISRPNLFIVGAPKSGTTSLYDCLKQHPEIFMPSLKEPHFFARDFAIPKAWCIRDEQRYLELFSRAYGCKRIGEASVWYLYSRTAACELRDFNADARIIVMLRNPIDAMYSLHGRFLWNCNEDIVDFEAALAAEADRETGLRVPAEAHMPRALLYSQVVDFAPQVERYLQVFGPDNMMVILFDEFVRDVASVYKRVARFLDVDDGFVPAFRVVNASRPITPRLNRFLVRRPGLRRALHHLLPDPILWQINQALAHVVGPVDRPNRISEELRARLMPAFAPKIEALERVINPDLSSWLSSKRLSGEAS